MSSNSTLDECYRLIEALQESSRWTHIRGTPSVDIEALKTKLWSDLDPTRGHVIEDISVQPNSRLVVAKFSERMTTRHIELIAADIVGVISDHPPDVIQRDNETYLYIIMRDGYDTI